MKRTALYDAHVGLGAKLVEFGGWEMPLLYGGIVEEHVHTRSVASVFDVSHMGRLFFEGGDAQKLLDRVCTRNCAKLAIGRCGYSHVLNEHGGILDDVIISRAETHWIMVCNAGNRERIVAHLRAHAAGLNVSLDDRTEQTVMMAVQGPAAMALMREHVPINFGELKRYAFVTGSFAGTDYTLFRSGYTGEDGVEIIIPSKFGRMVWEFIIQPSEPGQPQVRPAGLGARDTLRLEAGMPLYGHELSEQVDSLSAACGWAVDLTKDFIGVEPLRKIAAEGPKRKLVGLTLAGKRIARQGMALTDGGRPVGEVTSGTFSPTLQKSIAMAYIDAPLAVDGRSVDVDVRGEPAAATVCSLPFYKRPA